MAAKTISFPKGKGHLTHNNRDFISKNVVPERTSWNRIYMQESLEKAYEKCFGQALMDYNATQKRKDRRKENYLKEIGNSGNKEKTFYENIVQIGKKEDTPVVDENGNLTEEAKSAIEILEQYAKTFQERNPNLYLFNCVMHLDEATPHLHIDFVPFTTDSKRGLDTRVSMKGALKQQGFSGTGRSDTELNQWRDSEKEVLSKIMLTHGIEWEQKGTHEKHKSVSEFKRDKLIEEVENLQEQKKDLLQTMSAYKQAEEYAHLTVQKIKNNDDFDIPEPPSLMTAKTYKTKFIEPFIKRIMKIIENLARRCYRAEKLAEQAEAKIRPLEQKNKELENRLWYKNMALSKAEVKVRDFDRIRNHFGKETINQWLKEITRLGKNRSKSSKEIER